MRFAGTSTAGGREAARERQRRSRLSTPALRVRYPQVGSLQLDFDFSDESRFLPSPQVTVFHPPATAYFCFACPYSDCDGVFDLTRAVDLAVNQHGKTVDGQIRCAGTRHGGKSCALCMEYSITAQGK